MRGIRSDTTNLNMEEKQMKKKAIEVVQQLPESPSKVEKAKEVVSLLVDIVGLCASVLALGIGKTKNDK